MREALAVAVGTEAAGHTASTYRLQRKMDAGVPG